jgi:hemin uptake protein HemP
MGNREMVECDKDKTSPRTGQPSREGARRQQIRSHMLLGDAREVVIEHDGAEYILRVTSQNKLILTK